MLGDRTLGMGQRRVGEVVQGARSKVLKVSKTRWPRLSRARRWFDLLSFERIWRARVLGRV
jgi:hypothetical protein